MEAPRCYVGDRVRTSPVGRSRGRCCPTSTSPSAQQETAALINTIPLIYLTIDEHSSQCGARLFFDDLFCLAVHNLDWHHSQPLQKQIRTRGYTCSHSLFFADVSVTFPSNSCSRTARQCCRMRTCVPAGLQQRLPAFNMTSCTINKAIPVLLRTNVDPRTRRASDAEERPWSLLDRTTRVL